MVLSVVISPQKTGKNEPSALSGMGEGVFVGTMRVEL